MKVSNSSFYVMLAFRDNQINKRANSFFSFFCGVFVSKWSNVGCLSWRSDFNCSVAGLFSSWLLTFFRYLSHLWI